MSTAKKKTPKASGRSIDDLVKQIGNADSHAARLAAAKTLLSSNPNAQQLRSAYRSFAWEKLLLALMKLDNASTDDLCFVLPKLAWGVEKVKLAERLSRQTDLNNTQLRGLLAMHGDHRERCGIALLDRNPDRKDLRSVILHCDTLRRKAAVLYLKMTCSVDDLLFLLRYAPTAEDDAAERLMAHEVELTQGQLSAVVRFSSTYRNRAAQRILDCKKRDQGALTIITKYCRRYAAEAKGE